MYHHQAEPWAELFQLCAEDCDQFTHSTQRVFLFNMSRGIFPAGISVITSHVDDNSVIGDKYVLQFTPRTAPPPSTTLPWNLAQDLNHYNLNHAHAPLKPSFFTAAPQVEKRKNNSGSRSTHTSKCSSDTESGTNTTLSNRWSLNPKIPTHEHRVVITILAEWYCAYQSSTTMAPWHAYFFSMCDAPTVIAPDPEVETTADIEETASVDHQASSIPIPGRHTRNTRLMKVLDCVHHAAMGTGEGEAAALSLTRQIMHLHTLGDITLSGDDGWYYTNSGKDRIVYVLPPP